MWLVLGVGMEFSWVVFAASTSKIDANSVAVDAGACRGANSGRAVPGVQLLLLLLA